MKNKSVTHNQKHTTEDFYDGLENSIHLLSVAMKGASLNPRL